MEVKVNVRLGFSVAASRRGHEAVRDGERRLGRDALVARSPETITLPRQSRVR
jgi:hypothetical protein